MQYLVLGAKHYDFVNRETGERLTGVKITYVDQPENDAANRGYVPMSITADEDLWERITVCPAIYEFDFGMKATKVGGKPVVVLNDVKLVKEVKLPSAV
mgnify:CR=1 FL=1|jgi:hypothetical protein